MTENGNSPADRVPAELGEDWFVLLTEEQVREMPEPPPARTDLVPMAMVMSHWWTEQDDGDGFTLELTEVPPTEADIPTIEGTDLCEITIATKHAPLHLTLLVFSGLSEEGGADPNTLVYEISHRTSAVDRQFSISVEPEATVLSIPKSSLPAEMAMAVLQATWHGDSQADGTPLAITGTWATYVGESAARD